LCLASFGRKFNAVVYGIPECPINALNIYKPMQILKALIVTLNEKEVDNDSNSINNLYWLSKHKPLSVKPFP